MPKVDVDFEISERGATQTKAKLDGLANSSQNVASKLPRVSEGLSRVASSVMGPLGVATGLAVATERLIAFGEAGAHTAEQRAAFERFRSTVDATTGSLSRQTAAALEQSGALELGARGVEILGDEVGALLSVLRVLGPVFDVVGLGIEVMTAPLRLAGEGLSLLADAAEPLTDGLSELGEGVADGALTLLGFDDAIKTTTERMQGSVNIVGEWTRVMQEAAKVQAILGVQRKDAAKAAKDELDDQIALNSAYLVAATGGMMDVVANEQALRTAAVRANEQLEIQTGLLAAAEALGGASPEQKAAFDAAFEQATTIDKALVDLDEKRWRNQQRTNEGIREEIHLVEMLQSAYGVASEVAQGQLDALAEATAERRRELAGAQETLIRQTLAGGRQIARLAGQMGSYAGAGVEALEELAEAGRAAQIAQAQSWIGVADAAASVIGKFADVGWAHATLSVAEAVTEGALAALAGDVRGVVLAGIAATSAIAEQGLAESMGAKGSASGGATTSAATSAAAASVTPPSDLDRGGRSSGDWTAVINVDGRALGVAAIAGANKAGRTGGQQLDRRLVGTSSRRGRI